VRKTYNNQNTLLLSSQSHSVLAVGVGAMRLVLLAFAVATLLAGDHMLSTSRVPATSEIEAIALQQQPLVSRKSGTLC
jgi:hypothetical protein